MENINFLEINNSEIKEVSTSFVYPKGTYSLKLDEVKQVDGESLSRVVFNYTIEDVADTEANVNIAALIGKKITDSITIWNRTPEEIKESLGKVKFAAINSGAEKDTAGSLSQLISTAIGKVTMHKVFASAGKDGITRNRIDWTQFKPKA